MRIKILFLSALALLSGCVSSKIEKEFNEKKNNVILLIEPAPSVEKKTAINVLTAQYLHLAPKDSELLAIFNSYLLYDLDQLGYVGLVVRDQNTNIEAFKGNELVFSVRTEPLRFREFKHRETASDGANSKTVKMRGIEIIAGADAIGGVNSPAGNKEAIHVRESAQKEESQEGQFSRTVGVKDVVNGTKGGSVKYIYNITKLPDGVFQNLCLEGAKLLAKDIDFAIKRVYQKQQKEKNKKK